jgi:hypothetical protein
MLRRSLVSVRVAAAARSAATKAPAAPAAAAVKPAASFNVAEATAATSAAVRQGVDAWQREQQQLGGFTIRQDLNGIGEANGVHTARLSSQKPGEGTHPSFAANEKSTNEIGWVWVMPVLATVACWLWTHDFVVLYADWLTCEGSLNVYKRRSQLEQQMDKEAAELAKKERHH